MDEMEGINTTGYVANEMYDRINYSRGGYGSSYLAAGAMADGTALKEAIDNHSSEFTAGLSRVSDQNQETRRILSFDRINDNLVDSEIRTSDRLRDIERQIVQNAKDSAECCCDAKLEAQKNASDIKCLITEKASETNALILAVEGRANLDKLSEARSELTSLKTQIACGCSCPS